MPTVRLAQLAFSAIVCGLLSISCLAQTEDATISGRVTDQTGAVVAGVSVLLQSAERGTTEETTTNGGEFTSSPLCVLASITSQCAKKDSIRSITSV